MSEICCPESFWIFCSVAMSPVSFHRFLFRTKHTYSVDLINQVRLRNMKDLIHKLWDENELVKNA